MREHPFKALLRYFLQGLLILAPIIITIWTVTQFFNLIDSILPNLLHKFFPNLIGTDSDGTPHRIPGLGFIVVVLLVLLVGYISSSFVVKSLFDLFGRALERAPGIKIIYTTVKDFFEAFAGDKRKFNRSVLINVFADNVWIIGFVTDEELQKFELGSDMISVYVPQAYNFAGQLYLLPKDRVKLMDMISSGQAMKYAVTGGVVDLGGEVEEENK